MTLCLKYQQVYRMNQISAHKKIERPRSVLFRATGGAIRLRIEYVFVSLPFRERYHLSRFLYHSLDKLRFCLLLHSAVEESHNLPTGASSGGAERGLAGAAGDVFLYCPRDSLRVIRIGGHIGKAGLARGRGTSR